MHRLAVSMPQTVIDALSRRKCRDEKRCALTIVRPSGTVRVMTEHDIEIAQRLVMAREIAYPGIAPALVARRYLDTDASSLYRWERGGKVGREPRASRLALIARSYGCDINWLVTGVGRKPRRQKVGGAT